MKDDSGKYFFFAILVIVSIFAFAILKPFLAVVAVGAALAVVLQPVFRWFKYGVVGVGERNGLAALCTALVFLLILCVPLFVIATLVFNQSQDLYTSLSAGAGLGPFVERINSFVDGFLPEGFSFNLTERAGDFLSFLTGQVATIFTATLTTTLSFLLIIFTLFYFLKDGATWRELIVRFSPLSDVHDERLLSQLSKAIDGIVRGYLLIGLIQGILMGAGLAIFGIPHAALWGVVAAIASLIPTVGTALVSVPSVLYLIVSGEPGMAIGLAIWAVIVVGAVDNVLNPIIVGNKVALPPLIILFSVLGGVALMGPIGILIGPLALSFLQSLFSVYKENFESKSHSS